MPGPARCHSPPEELGLALEHVERVDVVGVGVRVDALEVRPEGELEHLELAAALRGRGGPGRAPSSLALARPSVKNGSSIAPEIMTYVELHAHSAYSFLDGASQPEELAARAAELGYPALALTDHDGVYGSLEFAHAAKHFGVRPITGAEVTLDGGAHVTLLVETRAGYANLCRLLTAAHAHTRDEGEPRAGAAVARPGAARGAARRARLPLRLRARRARRPRPERGGAARARVRPRPLLRRAAAAVRARRRAPERAPARPRRDARRADRRDRRRARARPRAAPRCRTCSSPSAAAPRSTAASGSGAATTSPCSPRRPTCSSASPTTATPSQRTAELAERLEFDLTEELGYRYPDFSDGAEPAIVQLRRVCETRVRRALLDLNGHKRRVRTPARGGARADRRARPRRLLPPPLGGARARARGRARGARPRLDAARAAARARARLLGRLARLLPDRPLARRPGREQPLARPLPQPRARVGPRHRPRLPARHPREAHRPRHRALRTRARLARREPSRRTARAARSATSARRSACRTPTSSGSRGSRTAGTRSASPTRSPLLPDAATKLRSPRWRAFASPLQRDRRPAAPHLAASRRHGHLLAAARRARAGAAGRDGGPPDVPVGQGLVRRRRLPQDRPARARDALGGRGVRRPDRAHRGEQIDLSRVPLDDPAVFEEIQRADTVGCFQIESRAQMQTILRTRPENARRHHDPGRARPAGADPGEGRPPVRRAAAEAARRPDLPPPADHPLLEEPLRETLGVVVFQDQVLDVAIHLAGFTRRRGGGTAARDEPQALACRARGVARAVRRRRAREGGGGGEGARALRQARRVLGLRVPEVALPPRSVCSRTSRRGCGTTTRRSSSPRSSTRSRWASIRRRRSSATGSGTAWRRARPT